MRTIHAYQRQDNSALLQCRIQVIHELQPSTDGPTAAPAPRAEQDSAGLPGSFQLRFPPLKDHEPGFAFVCDEQGVVDLDRLNDRELADYLYARTLIGRNFAAPRVTRTTCQ